ncbi:MAG: IPT/TIG domain-containing protein, partial [Planctomycetota bacterium]|nr:IPT/TIG domain-containing protein [Planctomycetota bacterium]
MNHPSRFIPRSFLPLVFLAAALLAPTATGFETLGMSWPTGRINYKVNPNFPDQELSGTPLKQVDLITCSADCWREQTELDLRFVYLGTTEAIGFDDQDGVNTVSWMDADVGDALAITIVSGIRDRIIGFDMVFFSSTNGRPNQWNGPRDPSGNAMDLRGIATHEFGHVLGLDHSADRAATMYASAINRGQHMRTLHEDDIAGGESLYQIRTGANPATRIIEVAPTTGSSSGGNEVELRGRNFTWDQNSTLWVGDKLVAEEDWTIEGCCLVRIHSMPPGNAGAVDIRINGELGDFTFVEGYRYEVPPPSPISVEPEAGPASGGIPITVLGRDFSPSARILVGGNPVEDSVRVDSGMICGTLPRHSGG